MVSPHLKASMANLLRPQTSVETEDYLLLLQIAMQYTATWSMTASSPHQNPLLLDTLSHTVKVKHSRTLCSHGAKMLPPTVTSRSLKLEF